MYIKSIFRLAIVGFVFCSCQSDSFQINGQSKILTDGDTICLIQEDTPNKVIATAIAYNGNFTMKGNTEMPLFCKIYVKRIPFCNTQLFLESGNINVELNAPPHPSRVSGSKLNNQWQLLNDSIKYLGRELIRITKETKETDHSKQNLYIKKIDSLHKEMSECILNTARRNRNNALGKYILENYKEPKFK